LGYTLARHQRYIHDVWINVVNIMLSWVGMFLMWENNSKQDMLQHPVNSSWIVCNTSRL